MERKNEITIDAVANIMKQQSHEPETLRNIKETIEKMKLNSPIDESEINARFDKLCKKYNYDLADFSTAKVV